MGKVIKKGGVGVTISSQSGHAYQMAKRCNEKRVMFEACRWAERGARVSSISRRTYNEWKRSIITGSDFLIDGGATASYYHGKLKPET